MVGNSLLRGSLAPVLWLSLGALAFANACSSSTSDPNPQATGGNGGAAVGNAGASGGGSTGVAGGTGGLTAGGNAGAAVGGSSGAMTGGTGGVVGGAGGTTAGTGGVAPGGAGSGGASAGGAMQADPGTDGDGEANQAEPYNESAEGAGPIGGAPEGQVSERMVYASNGAYPGLMFPYWIYVPAQYVAGSPAALMVFQDGPHYLGLTDSHFNTPQVFDNLIHEGAMPVTIALFTETGTEDGNFNFDQERLIREEQYSSYSDVFANFLIDELIPAVITNQYDIVNDPDGWAIGGQSSGGNCSLIVGMHRSDKFHKILTHNGAFDNADRIDEGTPGTAFPAAIANSPLLPLRVNLLSGPNDIDVTYEYNESVVAALMAKGYHYRYITGSGGHYPPIHAVADYPESLRWLWRGYTLPWYQ